MATWHSSRTVASWLVVSSCGMVESPGKLPTLPELNTAPGALSTPHLARAGGDVARLSHRRGPDPRPRRDPFPRPAAYDIEGPARPARRTPRRTAPDRPPRRTVSLAARPPPAAPPGRGAAPAGLAPLPRLCDTDGPAPPGGA